MKKMSITIFVILYAISASKLQSFTNQEPLDIGFGFGGTYGFLGLNINTHINDYFNIFYCIGLRPPTLPDSLATMYDESGYQWNWGAGLELYLPSGNENFRESVILYYGLNTWAEHFVNTYDIKNSPVFNTWGKGLSIGIGLSWKFPKFHNLGFDFDMYYTIQSESLLPKEFDMYGNERYPVKSMAEGFASIGLRYFFDCNYVQKKEKTDDVSNPLSPK